MATTLRRARKHRFHECASDALILYFGIDGNRPDTRNRGALVKTVAAQYPPARFGNHTIETGMTEHHGEDACRHLDRRKVRRESVVGRNLRKSLIADTATDWSVLWPGLADPYRWSVKCRLTQRCHKRLPIPRCRGSVPQISAIFPERGPRHVWTRGSCRAPFLNFRIVGYE